MASVIPTVTAVWLLTFVGPAAAEGVPDPEAARALGAKAQEALRAHEPAVAARWFEQALAVEPRAMWWVAAGEAWLLAGEPAVAGERFALALKEGGLGEAKNQIEERLSLARRLAPIVARAQALEGERAYARAMSAWEEAHATLPLGRFVVLGAHAAEKAGREDDVRRLAEAAEQRADLGADDARWVASVLARVRQRPVVLSRPARATTSLAPWIVIASGAAVAVAGGVALFMAEGAWDDVRSMKASADEGVVLGPTRADAARRADEAEVWSGAGWVAIGVGAVVVGAGVGWLLARDADRPKGQTEVVESVDFVMLPGGVALSTRGRF